MAAGKGSRKHKGAGPGKAAGAASGHSRGAGVGAGREAAAGSALPVDPARLKREFPALTDEDLAAYVEVTRSVLALPAEARGERMREVLEQARAARAKAGLGQAVPEADQRLVRYLAAIEKMQGPAGQTSH